jgi:hypothetical protein
MSGLSMAAQAALTAKSRSVKPLNSRSYGITEKMRRKKSPLPTSSPPFFPEKSKVAYSNT